MASLRELIVDKLELKFAKDLGPPAGGCISNSRKFATDIGDLFVKTYEKEKVCMLVFSIEEIGAFLPFAGDLPTSHISCQPQLLPLRLKNEYAIYLGLLWQGI